MLYLPPLNLIQWSIKFQSKESFLSSVAHFLLWTEYLTYLPFFMIDRAAYVSYGGLLMRLQGDANNLHGFEVDSFVYLLIKKLAFWLFEILFKKSNVIISLIDPRMLCIFSSRLLKFFSFPTEGSWTGGLWSNRKDNEHHSCIWRSRVYSHQQEIFSTIPNGWSRQENTTNCKLSIRTYIHV